MTAHNPENVPDSAVPSGWRFMLTTEYRKLPKGTPCRVWHRQKRVFSDKSEYLGISRHNTYIVPADFVLVSELATLHAALRSAYEALESEKAIVEKQQEGLKSFLRNNAQYWKDRQPTVDFYATQISRLNEALKTLQPHVKP